MSADGGLGVNSSSLNESPVTAVTLGRGWDSWSSSRLPDVHHFAAVVFNSLDLIGLVKNARADSIEHVTTDCVTPLERVKKTESAQ